MRTIISCLVIVVFYALSATGLDAAESWGAKMFSVRKHDFGRVAIGSDTVFRFELENIYEQDIRITGVHSSCSCTNVSLSTDRLRSEEKGAVIAKFNTTGQHLREKSAVLTVNLETVVAGVTIQETVQLFVSGYIRPDVVLTPGSVEFGSVAEGHSVTRTLQLEYAGREDWALMKIERSNPHVHARAEEVKRTGGEVAYKITVTLKDDTPVGYVKDVLRFTTNEMKPGLNEPTEIVLPIQGMVLAPIQARPSPFLVGVLSEGESVSKNIVVRGDKPFRIRGVSSDDKRYRFSFARQESAIQIISVLFSTKSTAVTEQQNLVDKITIRTNLPDQEFVTIEAHALLTPKENVAPVSAESASVKAEKPPLFAMRETPDDRRQWETIVLEKEIPDTLPPTDSFDTWTGATAAEPAPEVKVEETILSLEAPVSEEPVIPSGRAVFGKPRVDDTKIR